MEPVEVRLEACVEGITLDHPSAQAAAAELRADLRSQPQLRATERSATEVGSKGGAVDLVVTLGASGTVGALVRIIRLWLSRDRHRSLTVTVRRGAEEATVTVEGDPVSVGTLTDALNAAVGLEADIDSN